MNINDIKNARVLQKLEGVCEFALTNIEPLNIEPLEYKNQDGYVWKKCFFSCVKIYGYILPKETFTKPNKTSLEIRYISEIVNIDDKGNEEIRNSFTISNDKIISDIIYNAQKLNKSIVIDNQEALIIHIEPSEYQGQCLLVEGVEK